MINEFLERTKLNLFYPFIIFDKDYKQIHDYYIFCRKFCQYFSQLNRREYLKNDVMTLINDVLPEISKLDCNMRQKCIRHLYEKENAIRIVKNQTHRL